MPFRTVGLSFGLTLGAAVLLCGTALSVAQAKPFMIVGLDEKVLWDDDGKSVLSLPGKDQVLIVDLADPENPKIAATLQLENSVVGPPVNLDIDPSGSVALVANSVDVVKEGDAARGETIFRRKELGCVTCHAIGGIGGKVGPDMTSIGASAQVDYLIESVLYPNRKIKEGYHSVIVETKDGLDLSGVLVSESGDELILRDATGKETRIAKNNIQNRATGNSLMPGGLVDTLSPTERLDLYRFLSELGKPGEYDASKPDVARGWKLFVQTLDLTQFGDEKVLKTDLADAKWVAAHTLVDGRLLKDDMTASMDGLAWRDPQAVFAAARFQSAV